MLYSFDRRVLCLSCLLFILILLVAIVQTDSVLADDDQAAPAQETLSLEGLYQKLIKMEIDPTHAARLEGFSFKKDIFEWKFESGDLFLTRPVSECPNAGGAFFIGKGRMIFVPPNQIEKEELKRAANLESLNQPFQHAFFRFNDETRRMFEPLMQPLADKAGLEAAAKFKERQELLSDLTFNLEFPIIEDYFSGAARNSYLYLETDARLGEEPGWPAVFYNPQDPEELTFFAHQRLDHATGFGNILTSTAICKFHKQEDYPKNTDLGYEDKDLFHITHYDMDFNVVKHDLFLDAKVTLHLKALVDQLAAVSMPLYAEYDPDRHDKIIMINRITDKDGKPLPFLYKNFTVLVELPGRLGLGDEAVINFDYRGNFIRPDYGSEQTFTLLNTYPWFPQYGFRKQHTFKMTICVPQPNIAAASGTTVRRWEEGNDYSCLETREETPVVLTSFLFGRYYTFTDDADKQKPKIYVHTLFNQQRQAKPIYQETRTIVSEYEKYLGPFPFDELDIAQMGFGYGFGQAPPGLVQITGEAFLTQGELARYGRNATLRTFFLPHEVGHEWFGHVVGWRTYHDQWLSESFTEYLAGLYELATDDGQRKFKEKLDDWREQAMEGKDGGPIYLGSRLRRDWQKPFLYTAALYNKGPYVMHMLRMAFITSAKGDVAAGDKLFFDCLKAFCDKYRNQNATTADFQRVVKEIAKLDMDWFFEQWYRSSGIPEVHFAYKINETEDGKYLLQGKLWQNDKEHVKQLVIPIFLHFSGDKTMQMQPKFMDKAEMTFQAKLPQKPERVTIDDNISLLAKIVHEASWQE